MSNLDALVKLRPQPDVDGPGFFSDGDMLQTCNFGFGGTNCDPRKPAGSPGGCPNKGHMKQGEYEAQFATWAVMASQMIISADLRTLPQSQPDCFKLLLNADILAVSQDPAARRGPWCAHCRRTTPSFAHNCGMAPHRCQRPLASCRT